MQQDQTRRIEEFTRTEAIISSMTMKEHLNSTIINGSRRKHIVVGAGVPVSEVNNLLKQHAQMSKMFRPWAAAAAKCNNA